MSNKQRYDKTFTTIFSVDATVLGDSFTKDNVENWDSLRQLSLTTGIEEVFDILFDPEDILGFDSYAKGIEILRKYEIVL